MRGTLLAALLVAFAQPAGNEVAIAPAPVIPCAGGGHIRCSGNRTRQPDGSVTGTMTCQLGDPANNTDDCVVNGYVMTGTVDMVWSGTQASPSITVTGTVKRWSRGPTGGLVPAASDCTISLHRFGTGGVVQGQACGQAYNGPRTNGGDNTGGSGNCPGGQMGSLRACVQNGINGPCECNIAQTSMCVTQTFWSQNYGGQFPAVCAPQGASCVGSDGRTIVAYCCPGLSCNLGGGNACGGGALTCQKIP